MKSNIVLIGMPGAGKSTVGVILAKIMGYEFMDSDLLIQKEEGRLLREIIEQDGVDGFIAVENRVNAGIQTEKTIIATGGSVIYGKEAMAHLREIGTIVYLKLSYPVINSRLSNIRGRGVVLREGQNLASLYEERVPLYEKYADIVVESDGLTIEESISIVMQHLQNAD